VIGLTVQRGGQLGAGYLTRQLIWVGAGLFAMLVAFAIDYRRLLAVSTPLYLAGLVSVILVLPLGYRAGGAVGWFRIGSVGIQPSEFVKLATALLLARFLSRESERFLAFKEIAVVLAIAGVPMLLIALEPDLGGALMFAPMVAGLLLVAGVRLRWMVVAASVMLLVGALVWSFGMRDYQRQRVMTYLQPASDPLGAGYQVRQSKIAVGSGQLTGRGYRQGTQSQLRFLPARHTDFILAVLAEERGFLGVAPCSASTAPFAPAPRRSGRAPATAPGCCWSSRSPRPSPSTCSTTARWSSAWRRSPASPCPSSPMAARSP
jgi:rod shape determining protein RodA